MTLLILCLHLHTHKQLYLQFELAECDTVGLIQTDTFM